LAIFRYRPAMFASGVRTAERVGEDHPWSARADVVVVGAGLAGLTTAAHLADGGASVVVLEKAAATGGTARKAVGGMWVPDNRFMQEAGVADDHAGAVGYIARLSRPALYDADDPTLGLPAWEHEQLTAFVDHADAAFRALEDLGVGLEMDPRFPDYHGHLPEVSSPLGRQLFPHRPDGTRGDGASMLAELEAAVTRRGVPILLEHRVVGLLADDDGAIVGVRVATPDGELDVGAARAVVFGSGGFAHNPQMRAAYLGGHVLGGCAALTNEGDFQLMARGLGIPLMQMDAAWMAPMVLERALARDPDMMGIFAVPGDSLIIVNRDGRRVVNEKAPYHDRTRLMHAWDPHGAAYPNFLLFAVWDQRTAERFPGSFLGNFIPPADSPLRSTVDTADTLQQLAAAVDARLARLGRGARGMRLSADFAAGLEATIRRFNGFARTGVDEDFRRGETPIEVAFHGPVADDNDGPNGTLFPLAETGPYHATILAPGALDTKGGPRTDPAGRVLGPDDRPVAGLYALGNAAAQPTGHAYPSGGMTFGPIVTSAWLTAQALVAGAVR
jgi:succinate dehydrogenase/fumarate reductase flavoprotein subunit